MDLTGWSKGLEVTADGEGIVSHAGLAVLRQLADKTGLTGGLSHALASPRLLIHDRGRVTADLVPLEYSIEWLTCAIASGLDVVMVGLPGAAQDRVSADVPGTRLGRRGVPRRPGEGC